MLDSEIHSMRWQRLLGLIATMVRTKNHMICALAHNYNLFAGASLARRESYIQHLCPSPSSIPWSLVPSCKPNSLYSHYL